MRSTRNLFSTLKAFVFTLAVIVLSSAACFAQQAASTPKALTADDYARAEKFMGYKTAPLVFHNIRPVWMPDDKFWYRDNGPDGAEFMLYDAAKGTKQPAFDHEKVAAALSSTLGRPVDAKHLPFQAIEFSPDEQTVYFNLGRRRFSCDPKGTACKAESGPQQQPDASAGEQGGRNRAPEVLSPDKKHAVYIKDFNLWMRDTDTGKETQLTKDGVKDYGYATDNAGWTHSDRAVVLWSPDSKKIATFQQDQRDSGDMYLVDTRLGHPHLEEWKYPLPGDKNVTMIERVIIDIDSGKVVRLQMPPDQHRTTLCDDLMCRGGEWADVQWTADSSSLAFVSNTRDHKVAQLKLANASTGAVRDVLEEKAATQYESGQGRFNWRYLAASNEVIWFSERDDWGHLYLYDTSGKLKNQITSGAWAVQQLLRVDEKNRQLYFLAAGREKGDPYFIHFYRIGFDGKGLTLLTPEDANHQVELSPSGKYFLDSYSRPEQPGSTVLRDENGKMLGTVATTDISRLVAAGWKPVQPIVVKARDGQTDIYGLMYKPTNLDPTKKYPIINHIYPGPQGGSVGPRSFSASRGDAQALAELGFIVVEIDGMGNPTRSKKFHDFYYGNLGDNTLPDQIAGMKELAQKYPWIDIDRAGIYGHSGGGYATADAMFRYPDFFKVGISEAGNHDNREYEDDWGERYQGLVQRNADGTTNYDDQANENIAKNLKGHLLLAHGTMDDNVPPYNTLLVVNELIKANKDFDLLLLPNRHHGFGNEPYMVRRRWDYFVRYLQGAEPPKEFELHPPAFGGGQ